MVGGAGGGAPRRCVIPCLSLLDSSSRCGFTHAPERTRNLFQEAVTQRKEAHKKAEPKPPSQAASLTYVEHRNRTGSASGRTCVAVIHAAVALVLRNGTLRAISDADVSLRSASSAHRLKRPDSVDVAAQLILGEQMEKVEGVDEPYDADALARAQELIQAAEIDRKASGGAP